MLFKILKKFSDNTIKMVAYAGIQMHGGGEGGGGREY